MTPSSSDSRIPQRRPRPSPFPPPGPQRRDRLQPLCHRWPPPSHRASLAADLVTAEPTTALALMTRSGLNVTTTPTRKRWARIIHATTPGRAVSLGVAAVGTSRFATESTYPSTEAPATLYARRCPCRQRRGRLFQSNAVFTVARAPVVCCCAAGANTGTSAVIARRRGCCRGCDWPPSNPLLRPPANVGAPELHGDESAA